MDDVFGYQVDAVIDSTDALRAQTRAPSQRVVDKVIDHIDPLAERFIAAASLAFVASTRPDGGIDVTPRGDPAGFVHVLDRHTLALPDRLGNFRMDLFENVIAGSEVGLIFVVPGRSETLRVSGPARLVRDAALGDRLTAGGKPSDHILLIRVTRVLCHCPKAFVRGRVWDPESWTEGPQPPTLAEMIKAHAALPDTLEELEASVATLLRDRLY